MCPRVPCLLHGERAGSRQAPLFLRPAASLCLLFGRPDAEGFEGAADSEGGGARSEGLFAPIVGAALALVGINVFDGASEFGGAIDRPTVVAGLLLALALGLIMLLGTLRGRFDPTMLLVACALASLACVAACEVAMQVMQGRRDLLNACLHTVVLACGCVTFALGILLADLSMRPAGEVRGDILLALLNGGVAVGAMLGILTTDSSATHTALALVFLAMSLLALGFAWGARRARLASASPGDALGAACERLAARAGLSRREGEVLVLWASGHTLDYVADALCISRNTVKTHVTHIYKKTGVRAREDLIQLVERA